MMDRPIRADTPVARPPATAAPLPELNEARRYLWILAIGFSLAWLAVLGMRTLVPPDEARYAELAREMFLSHDWVTMRLNGIKYFEKPPLQTWMSALSFTLFGVGEWQARLWTGLCGLFGVFFTGYAAWRVFGARVGVYAALVLGSSLYWVASGQIDSLDMGLSAMLTLSLGAMLIAQRDEAGAGERRNWMLACWAGMALALLSKGLIGLVIPGAVLLLHTLVTRDRGRWRALHAGKGLLLLLLIAAPWFLLVAWRNPEQPYFFFVHEHLQRYATDVHKREGGWYYFLLLLVAGMVPWIALLPASVQAGLRGGTGRSRPRLLLLLWAGFILLFFSLSHSKLPGYIVPMFPALAILTALAWAEGTPRSLAVAAATAAAIGLALALAVPLAARLRPVPGGPLATWTIWALAGGGALCALAALAWRRIGRGARDLPLALIAIGGFLAAELMLAGFEPYGRLRAGMALLPAIRAELAPATKFYAVGTYEQAFPFYLRHRLLLVEYSDEFAFGQQQEPDKFISLAAFRQQWLADAAAGVRDLALMRPDIARALAAAGVPMRVIADDGRRRVVTNLARPAWPASAAQAAPRPDLPRP